MTTTTNNSDNDSDNNEYKAENADELPPVQVPVEALSPEILESLISEFVMREGTDYGLNEVDHSQKLKQIRRQLDRDDVIIAFDPNTESVTLLTKLEWQRRQKPNDSSLD